MNKGWREGAERDVNIVYPKDYSSKTIQQLLDAADSDVIFIGDPRVTIEPGPRMFDRMVCVMRETGAGLVYADAAGRPRIDYQLGSIRDNFDFGPVLAVSVPAARQAGVGGVWRWGGLYDLRLRLSECNAIVRIPEPLYGAPLIDNRPTGEKQFDYVDPRNRDYQIEMEQIATAHLKRIGAWLEPRFDQVPPSAGPFPVKASVVIPVRNRERTIHDAVRSALPARRFRLQCNSRRQSFHRQDDGNPSRHPQSAFHTYCPATDRSWNRRMLERGDLLTVLRTICNTA